MYIMDVVSKRWRFKFWLVAVIVTFSSELFPPTLKEPVPPQLPVFVSAFSSNHYEEGLAMIRNLHETVRQKYRDLKLIIYDLGLSSDEIKSLRALCSCEVRKFHFEKFPKHLKNLKNYAWKPVVIQTVAKDHSLLIWMDASVRFKTCHLDDLFIEIKRQGLMVLQARMHWNGRGTIAERTHKATFNFLHEDPCTYAHQGQHGATFLSFFANQFITKYVLRPWVSCALVFGCMDPVPNSQTHLLCREGRPGFTYHQCHRLDQSVLGILSTRLFHQHLREHAIGEKFYLLSRSTVETPSSCTLNNHTTV